VGKAENPQLLSLWLTPGAPSQDLDSQDGAPLGLSPAAARRV
jgi:hypothetical protein